MTIHSQAWGCPVGGHQEGKRQEVGRREGGFQTISQEGAFHLGARGICRGADTKCVPLGLSGRGTCSSAHIPGCHICRVTGLLQGSRSNVCFPLQLDHCSHFTKLDNTLTGMGMSGQRVCIVLSPDQTFPCL